MSIGICVLVKIKLSERQRCYRDNAVIELNFAYVLGCIQYSFIKYAVYYKLH